MVLGSTQDTYPISGSLTYPCPTFSWVMELEHEIFGAITLPSIGSMAQ